MLLVYPPQRFTSLPKDAVFVFGSNLAGRHGKGAARDALEHFGALRGRGEGIQNQSYALPTKDQNLAVLPLEEIAYRASVFLEFAKQRPELTFVVTPIGTGLSNYPDSCIAPLFERAGENCAFPLSWLPYFKGTAGLSW